MVPAFRYHVLTLVGVFLALGVGMLIGSSTLQGAIVDSLTRQLRELNAKFDAEVAPLRDENKRTTEAVAALRQDLIPLLKLRGRAAIVRTGDYPDAARDVRTALQASGITVSSTTTISQTFVVEADVHLNEVVDGLRKSHPTLPVERASLLRVLALTLARGGAAGELDPLVAARLIETEGDYSAANDYVILVGGTREEAENRGDSVDLAIVQQLKSHSARVFYVEPKGVFQSNLGLIAPESFAAIPSIDTEVGRAALAVKLKRAEPADETGRTALLSSQP